MSRAHVTPPAVDMRDGILAHCRARQLAHAVTWSEAEEPALRAAYSRTRMAQTKPFEEAMAIPAIARAVRGMAKSLQQSAGELFEEVHK